MKVLDHGLAFNHLRMFRTEILLQPNKLLLQSAQLFQQRTEHCVRSRRWNSLGDAFWPEVLPKHFQLVQKGCLPTVFSFAFNAQTRSAERRIPRARPPVV